LDRYHIKLANTSDQTNAYKWVMLGGVWLAYFSFGVVLGGIPPLVGPVSLDLGLSRSSMGTLLGAWPLVYIAVSIPAGILIDRFNLKTTIAAGIILIAVSGLLRAIAIDYSTMLIAVMVFGLGGPFISIGAPKLISIWFDTKQRGRAMGIYLTAPAVGRILVLGVTNGVLMPLLDYSWRWTLSAVAGTALISFVIWICVAREDPHQKLDEGGKDVIGGIKVFPELLQNKLIFMILLIVLGMFLFNHGSNNWMPEILSDKSIPPTKAGLLSAIPVAMGVVGSLIIPQISTPPRRRAILSIGFFVTALASLALVMTNGYLLYFVLILLGMASRGIMPVCMLILLDSVKPNRTGAVGGLYFTFGEVGGVAGPVILGVLSDLRGGFDSGIYLLSGMCFLLGLLSVTLKSTKQNILIEKE
jgi:CP family cyanate transporter-like MFS transporter